jgi:hypothetical protein
MTHHIVDRETQSARKIQAMSSSVRSKIEKFIDSHGQDILSKITRKKKQPSKPSVKMSPAESETHSEEKDVQAELPPQQPRAMMNRSFDSEQSSSSSVSPMEVDYVHDKVPYYNRRYSRDRPVDRYKRPYAPYYHRYPPPPPMYYRNNDRYYSPQRRPPYYRPRRPSISDDDIDRRRWD